MSRGRPFVCVNMAMTVDGKITSAEREYPKFSAPADRERMDRLRAAADALMVGAGTVRADNPAWHVRTPEIREAALAEGRPGAPHRVLVSASARVPEDSRFFDDTHGGRSILVTTRRAPDDLVASIASRAEVRRHGETSVDLVEALRALEASGIERLLVEGGGELNWALFAIDAVDELYVTLSPALLGGTGAPTILGGRGWPMPSRRRLKLLELEREGDELYLRYAVGG